MIRVTVAYEQLDEPEDFLLRYRQVHLPLVLQVPGLDRVTLSRPRTADGGAPGFVAEMWFSDEPTFREAMASPELAAASADAAALRTPFVVFSGPVETHRP